MGNGDSTCWDLYSRNWSSKENCDDDIIANDFSVKYSDIMCVYVCAQVCMCESVCVGRDIGSQGRGRGERRIIIDYCALIDEWKAPPILM